MLLVSQQYSNWGIRPTTDRGADGRVFSKSPLAHRTAHAEPFDELRTGPVEAWWPYRGNHLGHVQAGCDGNTFAGNETTDGASAGYVRKLAAPPQPISYADT